MMILTSLTLFSSAFAGPSEERDLLKQSCETGDARGCTTLGIRYRDGFGAPSDPHYAVSLFRKGCELGDVEACVHEADAYRTGVGVGRDPARAVERFTEACTAQGVGLACRALGELYILGDGVPRSGSTSHLWYEQGCAAGDAESCVGAAMGTERGDQGLADPQMGRRMLARACELGHARGCTLVGTRYLYGRDGATKDPLLASTMFSAGCELGDPEACREVGRMAMLGKGMPLDLQSAQFYLTDACAGDDYTGCRYLADVVKGTDLAKAVRAAGRGCELGDAASCKKKKTLAWKLQLQERGAQ